jgi:predicted TIM-barrel fold metal-dependent hydrolase
VEVDVEPAQREQEAELAAGLCRRQQAAVGGTVIGGKPGSNGFSDYVRKFAGNPCVRGVRASFPADHWRDPPFLADIGLLGELGLSFDLLLGASALGEAAELAKARPGTRFILDHCGNASPAWFGGRAATAQADQWQKGIATLSKQTNVACKISGVAENGPSELASIERIAPIVNHCLDCFGPDRVMFASNWPVCLKSITIRGWAQMLRQITAPRGEEFAAKLFSRNATSWYRLGA